MSVTLEELQKAGASPELARILADRLPRRALGDPTRNPMVVAVATVAFTAFLSTLGWLVLTTADTRTEVALLGKGQAALEERMGGLENRMSSLENQMSSLENQMSGLEDRMIRIEDKLDRLLKE